MSLVSKIQFQVPGEGSLGLKRTRRRKRLRSPGVEAGALPGEKATRAGRSYDNSGRLKVPGSQRTDTLRGHPGSRPPPLDSLCEKISCFSVTPTDYCWEGFTIWIRKHSYPHYICKILQNLELFYSLVYSQGRAWAHGMFVE